MDVTPCLRREKTAVSVRKNKGKGLKNILKF